MECKSQSCALCFKITPVNSNIFFKDEKTDFLVQEMLQTIYPQMKPTSADTLNICLCCEQVLETAFHFKANCLDVDDYLRNFSNSDDTIGMHEVLLDIYGPMKDARGCYIKICRLCLDVIQNNDSFRCYDDSVKKLMDKCLPELVLSLKGRTVFCNKCLARLDKQYDLIKKLENALLASNKKNQISNIPCDIINDCDQTQDVQISNNAETNSNILTTHKKMTPKSKRKRTSCELDEATDTEDNLKRCWQCAYTTKEKFCLELHILLTHSDVDSRISERTSNGVKTFACNDCIFESTRDYIMWSHVLTHKDEPDTRTVKCKRCNFKCNTTYTMRRHQSMHNEAMNWQPQKINPGEMYHCKLCSFKQYKGHVMKNHIYTHIQNNTRIRECKECTYKTNNRKCFLLHLECHKSNEAPKSIGFFQCVFCQFETVDMEEFTNHCDTCLEMKSSKSLYKIVPI